MSVHLGQILSHYRLDEEIGAGGMGIVYRARNLNLDTDVALKVLPELGLAHGEARRQFGKEAQCLSQLAHPNIALVHDFDTADGVDFLVMEYIPGVTLLDMLRKGPLPEPEVLRLGRQLVEGLECAHAHHIIHRDIKPGNLRITPARDLKILDFGLAKLLQSSESATTQSATDGRVGTLPYMAPEQFQGRADARSDVYGAGAVLYEMATGRRPFPQTETPQLLNAILHESLQAPNTLNRAISLDLERIILKALDRDPERRYQSMREMRVDLVRLQEPSPIAGIRDGQRRSSKRRLLLWTAAGTLAMTVAAIIFWPDNDARWLERPVLLPIAAAPSVWSEMRLSPDARWVSHLAMQGETAGLWVRHAQGGTAQRILTLQGNITSHVWSPDGEKIALLIRQGSGVLLQILPAFGGPPEKSVPLDRPFANAGFVHWLGNNLYVDAQESGLWRYDLTNGNISKILEARAPNGTSRSSFDICQDEHCALFELAGDKQRIGVQELKGDRATFLTETGSNGVTPHWLGPRCRFMVFSSDRSGQMDLWGLDVQKHRLHQITFSSSTEHVLDTSADGSQLLFEQLEQRSSLWVLHPDTLASRSRLTHEAALDHWPSLSRDGRWVAFQRQESMLQGIDYFESRIMLAERRGAELIDMRMVAPVGGAPQLSAAGTWLAFARPAAGGYELCMLDVNSGHSWQIENRFDPGSAWAFPQDWMGPNLAWSPDGTSLFFVSPGSDGRREIRRLPAGLNASTSELVFTSNDSSTVSDLFVSPDGTRLCFASLPRQDAGTHQICCIALATGERHTLMSWRPDRPAELRLRGYRQHTGDLLVLRVVPGDDYSQQLDVLDVAWNAPPRSLGRVERGFVASSRLDPRRDRLYVTKSTADGVHNLFAIDLQQGTPRQLTDNTVPSVSYSGPTFFPDGRLLYSQQEKGFSSWLIRFAPADD